MSFQLGRPRMIHVSDCTLNDPIDCDFPLEPFRTLLQKPDRDARPSSYTLQLVKYKVGHLIHQMMSIGATHTSLQDYTIIQSLQEKAQELLEGLPPSMKDIDADKSWDLIYPGLIKQRLQIMIVIYSFIVALHRPHADRYLSSRQNGTDAALRSLEALHQLFENSEPHHYKIYTLVFYTIDIGIFLTSLAIKYHTIKSQLRTTIRTSLEKSIGRLSILKRRNKAAIHGEVVLKKCMDKYTQACVEGMLADVNPPHEDQTPANSTLASSGDYTNPLSEIESLTYQDITTTTTVENYLSFDDNLLDEILNERVSTTSWLENMQPISSPGFDFNENDTTWENFLN